MREEGIQIEWKYAEFKPKLLEFKPKLFEDSKCNTNLERVGGFFPNNLD